MPRGDETKEQAFPIWLDGKPLEEIQEAICTPKRTKPNSVTGWIRDWERGRQGIWSPTIN